MTKHLLSIYDLNEKAIKNLLLLSAAIKNSKKYNNILSGKTLGLIFEKPSTRTTVSFAVAMYQLGGYPLILQAQNLQRQRGETLHDTAKTLSRYLDGVVIRAFKHSDVQEFARGSSMPVINGLTDLEHPCQALGDMLTIMEKKKLKNFKDFKKIKIVFVGDGNNMANSLIGACAFMGCNFVISGPDGYSPNQILLKKAEAIAKKTGAKIEINNNPQKAVEGADIIYTDVWTSMGEENERSERLKAFKSYQVNKNLLNLAKKDCIVMHCLPAIRGEEISAEVMDGPNSVVFDQAENRLHVQKAVLVYLLK
ncbi:MAG: ornithine carbamoyltransferase [Elusimicrobia bacterium]|nr:ornithine carbamoyltransferase [Elusimicrobiota bacterium]